MKTITFTQHLTAHREITINIIDEELLKQKSQEWLEDHCTLNHWDLEESFFEGAVEVEYSEIDWSDEDNDEFFDVMIENSYEVVSE